MTHSEPVPAPTARLMAAADHLRQLLASIATENPADLPLHADGGTVTQGRTGLFPYAVAETSEVAALIVATGPLAGEAIAAVLEQAVEKTAGHRKAAGCLWDEEHPEQRQAAIEEFMADHFADIAPLLQLADAILAGADQ